MSSAKPAWWLTVDGQSYGPYDLRTMQGYIAEGRVTGESIVCRVGDQTWSPARGDSLLFRGSAAAPPPFAGAPSTPGGAAAQGYASQQAYAPQEYTPPADAGAPPAIGGTKKIVLAVLGAALVGLFFAPWVSIGAGNLLNMQLSGYDIVRSYQMLYGGGMPSMPGMPGRPGMQVDMGWRAYQPFLLYLIPLAGIAVFATALAGLRLWRVAAIACGVVVWGILALSAVQASDAGLSWSQLQDSLRFVAFGFYGTFAVATVITVIGFTRS